MAILNGIRGELSAHRTYMASMQLGQLLLCDVPKAAWNLGLERLLQRFELAGVLFRRATRATTDLCASCARALDQPPFLAIEEEGGGSLSEIFAALPALNSLDPAGAARAGDLIGRGMALLGLNLNLAPTVDLPAGPAPAARHSAQECASSSDVALKTAHRAEAFVGGLTRYHVLACARHFPGMPVNPQSSPALVVDKTMAALWREDLVPYRTMASKCAVVQITHAIHKAYDYEFPRPASLSPAVVEGLLRVKLGYQGVAMADASLASRAAGIELGEAAVRAVVAGCDLVLVPGEEKRLVAVLDSLHRALDLGTLSRERVEAALGRLKRAKKGLAKPAQRSSEADFARLQREFAEFRPQPTSRGHGIT